MSQNAEAKNVHQWIPFEAFVEINFATDGRDADAIAIVCNPRDDAGEEAPVGGDLRLRAQLVGRRSAEPRFVYRLDRVSPDRMRYRPEAQRVKAKLRACAHRENITNNSANAGGGALEWFNCARMIV